MTMPLPEGVPPFAERLDYAECLRPVKEASRFAPGRIVKREEFNCVSCGEPMPLLELKLTVACPECGLYMRREMFGDLFIWRREVAAA